MTKREMMVKAHGLAKQMVGNYSARLSLALRQLWDSLKKGVVIVMIKAVGNTYKAKAVLKDAGFTWDANLKLWIGDVDARMEFGRITTATYSRANQKLAMGVEFEEI